MARSGLKKSDSKSRRIAIRRPHHTRRARWDTVLRGRLEEVFALAHLTDAEVATQSREYFPPPRERPGRPADGDAAALDAYGRLGLVTVAARAILEDAEEARGTDSAAIAARRRLTDASRALVLPDGAPAGFPWHGAKERQGAEAQLRTPVADGGWGWRGPEAWGQEATALHLTLSLRAVCRALLALRERWTVVRQEHDRLPKRSPSGQRLDQECQSHAEQIRFLLEPFTAGGVWRLAAPPGPFPTYHYQGQRIGGSFLTWQLVPVEGEAPGLPPPVVLWPERDGAPIPWPLLAALWLLHPAVRVNRCPGPGCDRWLLSLGRMERRFCGYPRPCRYAFHNAKRSEARRGRRPNPGATVEEEA